jgi:hypothetical protein
MGRRLIQIIYCNQTHAAVLDGDNPVKSAPGTALRAYLNCCEYCPQNEVLQNWKNKAHAYQPCPYLRMMKLIEKKEIPC